MYLIKISFVSIMALTISTLSSVAQTVTHKIILTVDTDNINDHNVNTTCNFGQSSTISNEDFSIQAKKGDIIEWRAANEDLVKINWIKHENGQNLFRQNRIDDAGGLGVVRGLIELGEENDEMKYSIKFKVQGKGTFIIDPKIIIKN